ncbi:hypothetical protein BDC45DRAFT_518271 [Circinella umbellata]|nr:hypothetical protein BDC45DRAFT_518271 [Circinella umbellata]
MLMLVFLTFFSCTTPFFFLSGLSIFPFFTLYSIIPQSNKYPLFFIQPKLCTNSFFSFDTFNAIIYAIYNRYYFVITNKIGFISRNRT